MELIWAIILAIITTAAINCKVYQIGFLLNDNKLVNAIEDTVDEINIDSSNSYGLGTNKINASWYNLTSNPIKATTDMCEHLIANSVYVVITTNAVNSTKSPDIVSYACAFYKIPTIVVQARETELSDKVWLFFFLLFECFKRHIIFSSAVQ